MEVDLIYQQFVAASSDELDRIELGGRVAEHLHHATKEVPA